MTVCEIYSPCVSRAGSTSGRVQAACTVSLLEAAQCVARASLSLDDVTCLMAGLQNPLEVLYRIFI